MVIVNRVIVLVLLRITLIDRYIRIFHPTERNVPPHHSLPVAILMVHKQQSETEKNSTNNSLVTSLEDGEKYLKLLLAPLKRKPKS